MRQRPGRLDALLLQRDRGGLHRADPDRQVAVTVGLAQQEDRLVRGQFDSDAHHAHLAHAVPPPDGPPSRRPAPPGRSVTASDAVDATRATPRARASGRAAQACRRSVEPRGPVMKTSRNLPICTSSPFDEHRRVHRLPVHVRAVEAADVDHDEVARVAPELGVPAGDGDVVEEDVAVGVAPGARRRAVQQEPRARVGPALDHQQRRTRRQRVDARAPTAPARAARPRRGSPPGRPTWSPGRAPGARRARRSWSPRGLLLH